MAERSQKNNFFNYQSPSIRRKDFVIWHCSANIRRKTLAICSVIIDTEMKASNV